MWGLASVARCRNQRISGVVGRCIVARLADKDPSSSIVIGASTTRNFARRSRTPVADIEDIEQMNLENRSAKTFTAADMEFFNQFADTGFDDDDDDDDEAARVDKDYRRKQEEIQRELDSRTGRPWTDPWEISEEQWMSSASSMNDLPDWSEEYVSRISQERVKVHPDGIPTLAAIAELPLPPPVCPHPGLGGAKPYAAYRKRRHFEYISEKVKEMAKAKVEAILALPSWDEKQDAVDELFESLELELKAKEEILGKHPDFGEWVERALHAYLATVNTSSDATESDTESKAPVFMDCFSPNEENEMVPTILSPLKPHPHDGPGRMVEEWELAANKKTKRILIRDSTRIIAKILEENDASRIYVHGRKGIGKSAVLASVVASARRSGNIVMFLPDGDRLRRNGFFITPNAKREGIFDLQNLSQEACAHFLASHEKDLEDFTASKDTMEQFFKESQLKRVTNYSGESMGLVDLLKYAAERKTHAPMCYSVVVETLMNQEEKPFILVLDEFNCFYDRSQYFHMAYDDRVREPIPYEKFSLFKPAMEAMTLQVEEDPDTVQSPKLMKRGGIIVGVTESHAVPRKVTDGLTASAERQTAADNAAQMHVVEVPRFSDVEADCILANFEATGVGKLRLDRGDTVINDAEVAYLKMISGNIGQQLLDASVM
mmetsp:Transcript_49332/g.75067  ORF Transcript_49332/g.75067 Transcript_49332/m.75067 type:complete len:663 (-) Transcript_49332:73-2061(-)